jgi:hypothetical protein
VKGDELPTLAPYEYLAGCDCSIRYGGSKRFTPVSPFAAKAALELIARLAEQQPDWCRAHADLMIAVRVVARPAAGAAEVKP